MSTPCIHTTPYSIPVTELRESMDSDVPDYYVRVTSTIRIEFSPPSGGRIDSVDAGGPDCGIDAPPPNGNGNGWVEFTTSNLGTLYSVKVAYTTSSSEKHLPPSETPTVSPKFKPQATCPTFDE